MDFIAFNKCEIEKYKAEAKAKWGNTKEYKEYEQRKNNGYDSNMANQMMNIFSELGAQKHLPPDDKAVQDKIGELQSFITNNYYTCSNQTLHALGQMYVNDERFKKNIDKAGGEGTAEFANRAIEIFCSGK